ncbi:MAG: DUF1893 domain-containing protein [Firmicutes bacterium]|nr:DUF1893 domain-containing protein [Bacillota bacterium]
METKKLKADETLNKLKEKLAGGASLAVAFDGSADMKGSKRAELLRALAFSTLQRGSGDKDAAIGSLLNAALPRTPLSVRLGSDGKSAEFFGTGIKPLLSAVLSAASLFKNAVCADKIVGKAAALIFAYAKAGFVYAETVSHPALEILKTHGIPCEYAKCVPFIQNRAGLDQCPMELLCADTDSPEEAVRRLRERVVGG